MENIVGCNVAATVDINTNIIFIYDPLYIYNIYGVYPKAKTNFTLINLFGSNMLVFCQAVRSHVYQCNDLQ